MSWLNAVPAVLFAGFWALGPGLLVAYAVGLRNVVAWGAAPLLSVALSSIPAVAAGALGIRWGVWVPLGSAVLVAGAVLGSRDLVAWLRPGRARRGPWSASWQRLRQSYVRLRTPQGLFARVPASVDGLSTTALPQVWPNAARRAQTSAGRAPWRIGAAATAGAAAAAVLGGLTVLNGIGPADGLSQTFDAVFHYGAVAQILGTGNASSMQVGTLANPMASTAFYPGAWHDMVSLAALSTSAGVPVATNATALAVAVVVWPMSCLFLVRQVAGPSIGAALATPVLAVGFTAFPWALMSFGVLWPNLLGVALLPAALAAVVTLLGLARESHLGRPGAAVLLVVAGPTLGLAHPNAVFSLAALALFPTLWWLAGLVRRRLFTRWFVLPLLAAAGTVAAVSGVVWVMVASPLLAGVRSYDWKAFSTPGQAAWDVVWGATNNRPEAWTVSVLVLVGVVFALRRVATSWLVPAHLLSGFLYLQSAARETELAAAATGAWYNDSYRLAAMVPITGVALAVLGALGLAGLLRRAVGALPVPSPRALPGLLTVAVLGLAVTFSGGMDQRTHVTALAGPYQKPGSVLLDPGRRAFLERAGGLLPDGAVVAANPFTGNALLYPLTGREVLYPHLSGAWTPEQRVIAGRLRDVATDPAVCAAVATTGTGYVLPGPATFWPWSGAAKAYPGLLDIADMPGFELMADDGRNQLYRITACGPAGLTDS